jgi:hypothetical protein
MQLRVPPNLITRFASPEIRRTSDPERVKFYTHDMPAVRGRNSSLWVGDETYFDGMKHLLPNRYLDLDQRTTHRYWPSSALAPLPLAESADRACQFLQGMMKAVTERAPVMLAVLPHRQPSTPSRGWTRSTSSAQQGRHDLLLTCDPRKMLAQWGPFHVHDVGRCRSGFCDIF